MLLAVSCAAVGVAAVVELNGFLTGRLDQQLRDAGVRFPASLEHGGSLPSDHDGDEDGDTRRQSVGTFGARLVGDTVTDAAVVDSSSGAGTRPVPLGAADRRRLAAVPTDGGGHTIDLSSLDDYRVMAAEGKDGDVLITGLPMESVEVTVHRLELVAAVVFGAALAVAGVAGALWVRWSLRPLSSVAATAARVSELPLSSGEVTPAPRAPESDPRSEVGRVAGQFGGWWRRVRISTSLSRLLIGSKRNIAKAFVDPRQAKSQQHVDQRAATIISCATAPASPPATDRPEALQPLLPPARMRFPAGAGTRPAARMTQVLPVRCSTVSVHGLIALSHPEKAKILRLLV